MQMPEICPGCNQATTHGHSWDTIDGWDDPIWVCAYCPTDALLFINEKYMHGGISGGEDTTQNK